MEKTEMPCDRTYALPCFLAGLGTGVALAMLFAPNSGSATRVLIRRKLRDGEDWAKDQAAATRNYARSQSEGLRDRVKDLAEGLAP